MDFRKLEQSINFELTSSITWGVKNGRHRGYSIPVALDNETSEKIGKLSREHNARSPLYGRSNTIYLRSKNLSPKQKSELFEKCILYIEINFELVGINTNNDISYLSFRVTKLRKTEKPSEPESDSCPED